MRLSDEAIADLEDIHAWQTQPGSGARAKRRLFRIRAAIRRLKSDPCLFPVGAYPGVREMPAEGGHRVYYTVIPDTGRSATAGDVFILRVFGPGQSRDRF